MLSRQNLAKGIQYLEKHGVEYKMFDREFQQIIEKENKEFLKQALQRKKDAEEEEDLRTAVELPIP